MSTQGDYLTGIADAIRAKEGSSDPIPANTFAERIAQITTGYDTSDATAQASHILSPYTAYGASGKITGTIPSQAGKTITPGTAQQTAISSGTYASGNILVAGDANLKAQNIKSGVSIFGVNGEYAGRDEFAHLALWEAGGTQTVSSSCSLMLIEYTRGSFRWIFSITPAFVVRNGPMSVSFMGTSMAISYEDQKFILKNNDLRLRISDVTGILVPEYLGQDVWARVSLWKCQY